MLRIDDFVTDRTNVYAISQSVLILCGYCTNNKLRSSFQYVSAKYVAMAITGIGLCTMSSEELFL